MFRNTLTANDKYPVWYCVNLSSPIQTQISLKSTIYSDFPVLFLESTPKFQHFETKDNRHTYFISEITECDYYYYFFIER